MKQDNPRAFPHALTDVERGMTLRDYFAAHAAQGFVMAHTIAHGPDWTPDGIAVSSYLVADAMLAERSK